MNEVGDGKDNRAVEKNGGADLYEYQSGEVPEPHGLPLDEI
jgi:hypothetical protein